MAGSDKIHRTEVIPAELLNAQHLQNLLCREWHKGLDGDGDISRNLQRNVKDGLHTLGICLHDLPRLGVGKIFISDAGKRHSILQRLSETVILDIRLERRADALKLSNCIAVIISKFATLGHSAAVIFLGQHQSAVHEVTEDRHELVVVASLEILPRKVVILGLGRIGAQNITQHILLAGELIEVLVQPHGPILRG